MSKEVPSIYSAYAAARSGTAQEYATRLIVASLQELLPSQPSGTVLDLGCGYSNVLFSDWLLRASKVIGIDRRYEDVKRNPSIHFRIVGDVEKSPLANSSVDMIVSSFVIEHVADPSALFHECSRVLKPNGVALFCTPCLFGYKTLIARFCGDSVSNWIWRMFKDKPHPPWPDYYRANTRGRVKKLCAQSGLVLERLALVPEIPHFFYKSPLLFGFARAWDRVLDVAHLDILHNCMVYMLRRQSEEKSGVGEVEVSFGGGDEVAFAGSKTK